MNHRFPPVTSQSQINAEARPRAIAAPAPVSLPWGEWLLAAVALLLLAGH